MSELRGLALAIDLERRATGCAVITTSMSGAPLHPSNFVSYEVLDQAAIVERRGVIDEKIEEIVSLQIVEPVTT